MTHSDAAYAAILRLASTLKGSAFPGQAYNVVRDSLRQIGDEMVAECTNPIVAEAMKRIHSAMFARVMEELFPEGDDSAARPAAEPMVLHVGLLCDGLRPELRPLEKLARA